MGSTVMSSAEKMMLGGQTTALGILVVFVALFAIIIIIMLLSAVLKERKKQPQAEQQAAAPAVETQAPVVQATPDDSELVAVLTAAVAYCMTGDAANTSGLVIRSYRRIEKNTAWGNAGRNSQIFNKF